MNPWHSLWLICDDCGGDFAAGCVQAGLCSSCTVAESCCLIATPCHGGAQGWRILATSWKLDRENAKFWKECTSEGEMLAVLYDFATRLERRVQPGERDSTASVGSVQSYGVGEGGAARGGSAAERPTRRVSEGGDDIVAAFESLQITSMAQLRELASASAERSRVAAAAGRSASAASASAAVYN